MPGLTYSTRNRQTGTTIELYDTNKAGPSLERFGTNFDRWVIICTAHGEATSYEKQARAYVGMTHPTDWCKQCRAMKGGDTKESTKSSARRQEEPEFLLNTEALSTNTCSKCRGVLKGGKDGHWHETDFPVHYICCKCKGHIETEEAIGATN